MPAIHIVCVDGVIDKITSNDPKVRVFVSNVEDDIFECKLIEEEKAVPFILEYASSEELNKDLRKAGHISLPLDIISDR